MLEKIQFGSVAPYGHFQDPLPRSVFRTITCYYVAFQVKLNAGDTVSVAYNERFLL